MPGWKQTGSERRTSVTRTSLVALLLIALSGCRTQPTSKGSVQPPEPARSVEWPLPQNASPQLKQMLAGAVEQVGITTGYDPAYVKIDYPSGDVPLETGVCSDVLVRAFRKAGIDLQKEVHEDMVTAWGVYPRKWGSPGPDSNIDHRRVLNLMTYFDRRGKLLPITDHREDYVPGDIVSWDLGGGVPHIGIVSNRAIGTPRHLLIIHNIGAGTRAQDVLFNWKITGHYRYF
ncbi:MAG TPA: DUF1287 domain-containing protein [Pyrinomonadaceae bacterium]|nr:DUF1287 domain-containing protein [Pyrinomonadaceae bacterium]